MLKTAKVYKRICYKLRTYTNKYVKTANVYKYIYYKLRTYTKKYVKNCECIQINMLKYVKANVYKYIC